MKPGRLSRPAMQDYRNRDFVLHYLDDRHFNALNAMDVADACTVHLATTGCLDALDLMPAGSMVSLRRGDAPGNFYDQSQCVRGRTLAELQQREALAARLIDELLSQEKRNEESQGPDRR